MQSDKVQFTTPLSIEASDLIYDAPVILSGKGSPSFPKKSFGTWSDRKIDHCLPTIGFVNIDAGTGALSLDGTKSTEGAAIGEDSSETPQPSTVCKVSALRNQPRGRRTGCRQVSSSRSQLPSRASRTRPTRSTSPWARMPLS